MALVKDRLKAKIIAAFEAEQTETEDHNASLERISDKLAQAIIEEIKFLTINYTAGLIAPPSGGPVTGIITHTVL